MEQQHDNEVEAIDWKQIEIGYKKALPSFNVYRWNICKNQLISIGMPIGAVAFVMSAPKSNNNWMRFC